MYDMADIGKMTRSHFVLKMSLLFSMLISFLPVVDYYCSWYITILPLVIVFIYSGGRKAFNTIGWLIIISMIYSFFSYWFIYRNANLANKLINDVVLWVPAIYAYRILPILNSKEKQNIVQFASTALLITSITTIHGLTLYPMAARELASGTAIYDTLRYSRINIGGYDFVYGIVCAVPIQLWLIKHTRRWSRIYNIIVLSIFFYTIVKSQYTTALLLFIALFIFSLSPFTIKRCVILVLALVFALFFLRPLLIDVLQFIRDTIASEYVSDRILQVIQLLNKQTINTYTLNNRITKYENALFYFLKSPLIGNNIFSFNKESIGGHSTILDILAGGGIVGIIIYYKIVQYMTRLSGIVSNNIKSTLCQVLVACALVALFNPLSTGLPYCIFFICGGCINKLDENSA